MEQDVNSGYRSVCCTCLSSDRDLFSLSNSQQLYEIFRLLMYDFAGDRLGEPLPEFDQLICWECVALMKKVCKFKWQVQNAQEHIRVLALSQTQETMDHTYMSQSLSSLAVESKTDYDKIYVDYSSSPDDQQRYITIQSSQTVKDEVDISQALRGPVTFNIEESLLGVPEMVLENSVTGLMTHIVVGADGVVTNATALTPCIKGEPSQLTIESLDTPKLETVILCEADDQSAKKPKLERETKSCGYTMEWMTEADMLAHRESLKKKPQYCSAVYKCELCVIGFYSQQQVEEHFVVAHKAKSGCQACKVCYTYINQVSLEAHTQAHYLRCVCSACGYTCASEPQMKLHSASHHKQDKHALIIGDTHRKKKKDKKAAQKPAPKPGDLRKLLSKTTIEGYQCLECDMFFKNSRARKNHVARFHREGMQCDHCKKRFVNRTTLTTHLKLHSGPPPREECPVCHKMVRVVQLKYHVARHHNKGRYECAECDKVFSHAATYQAHLKYSRAHASDQVFRYPCPMCNKGYPTKEAMQDHFNYQHLGKTSHKCPVCDKPIASRANVEKHISRVHGEKKNKPRSHQCQVCGKGFTDKKALSQHEVIHSGERPLSCDICHQTFKQKASLYTHRKRVHKVFPAKRVVTYVHEG